MKQKNSTALWRKCWSEIKFNKLALVSFCYVVFMVCVALLAPFLAPHDPDAINLVEGKLLPPVFLEGGSMLHFLGTDSTGRDLLSRILYGARVSMFIGFVPVVMAFSLGVPVGLLAGFFGGAIDSVVMRINDVLLAFPAILLALIVVAILGPGILNCMLAVGIVAAPSFALIVRGAVVSERHKEYVTSALAQGAGRTRIIFRHILPNITSALIVVSTLNFAAALLETAALSFLGLGVQPPTAEWGSMLADGKNYFNDGWWMIIFPGIAIFFVVMSLNIIGDTLRDAFDPRIAKKG